MDTTLDVVERVARQDPWALDEFVAEDLVNHAAGLQGREGLKTIFATTTHDLGDTTVETHHLFAHGDLVTHHMSLHGVHRASTMPLLQGVEPTGRPVTWTFIHIWRVADGSAGRALGVSRRPRPSPAAGSVAVTQPRSEGRVVDQARSSGNDRASKIRATGLRRCGSGRGRRIRRSSDERPVR